MPLNPREDRLSAQERPTVELSSSVDGFVRSRTALDRAWRAGAIGKAHGTAQGRDYHGAPGGVRRCPAPAQMSTAPTQPVSPRPLPDDDLPPEAPQTAPAARRRGPLPQPALTARGWIITIVCGLLFAGAGAIVALQRHPTYSAESLMNVGAVNLRVQAQSGYTAGAEALASSYSRVAVSGQVVRPVAAKLSLTPDEVSSRLAATPIPDEPQFKIIATGPTATDAIALADTATRQMQTFADQASTGRDSASTLLKRYQRQSAKTAKLRERFFLLKGLTAESTVTGATPEQQAAAPSQAKLNRGGIAFNTAV